MEKNFAARDSSNCIASENELGLTIKGTGKSVAVVSVMFV